MFLSQREVGFKQDLCVDVVVLTDLEGSTQGFELIPTFLVVFVATMVFDRSVVFGGWVIEVEIEDAVVDDFLYLELGG